MLIERPPIQSVLLPGLLMVVLLSGCGQDPRDDTVIVTVNGVPVTQGEFLEQWNYERSFREFRDEGDDGASPALKTEQEVKAEIVQKKLIPMAAVKARYGERIPALMKEAQKIVEELAPEGANFAELAARYSLDSNADDGGSWRTVTRYALYYPVSRRIFSAQAGEILGPFISLVGCHIVLVEQKTQGMLATDDTAVASHILLPFEKDRFDFIPVVTDRLVREAEIEVIDRGYAPLVGDLAKKPTAGADNGLQEPREE